MKEILFYILLLLIGNYAYRLPTYLDNKNREWFLNKLISNKCSNTEIRQELLRYSLHIDKVIKIYDIVGSNLSELIEFKNDILLLSEKANNNVLTTNDRIYIEDIFSRKLRVVSWFPFFTKKQELNREFLWV